MSRSIGVDTAGPSSEDSSPVAAQALSLGGVILQVDTQDQSRLPADLRPFVVGDRDAQLRCHTQIGPIAQQQFQGPALFDSGGLWRVYGEPDAPILALQFAGKIYQYARLNADLSEAEVYLDPGQLDPAVTPFGLRQPLLELWYAFWLLRGHGLLLHGCGVLDKNGAVDVFLGKSGAGKSTFAGLVTEAGAGEILSDDRLIVRSDGAQLQVYGTPWHGEARFAMPKSGRLRSLHFLRQAQKSRRQQIGAAQALQQLYTCSFLAGWPRQAAIDAVLEQGQRLVQDVATFVLDFCLDHSALHAAQLQLGDAQLPRDEVRQ